MDEDMRYDGVRCEDEGMRVRECEDEGMRVRECEDEGMRV